MKFDTENFPNGINFILIFILFSLSSFIAAIFQNISDYISLISSLYGLFIGILIPGIIYIKLGNNAKEKKII